MSPCFNHSELRSHSSGRRTAALLVVAGLALLTTLPSAQTGPGAPTARLQLVSTVWAPFTNAAGKERFATDLVDEGLKRIGVAAATTIVDNGALSAALRNERFSGSAALWKDREREGFLIFSEPYLQNRLVLVGRHGSDVSATSLASLRGKRIALVEGYAYGDAVTGTSAPTFLTFPRVEESIERLLAGGVDYTLTDELVIQYLIQEYSNEVSTRLAIGTVPLVVRPLHLALRRNLPGAQSIIDRFNHVLNGMVADRSYHRLLHIPWIEADIDGDGRTEYVPDVDQISKAAPSGGYKLFSTTPEKPEPATPEHQRYYVGGSIYEDWVRVPDAYKVKPAGAPAPVGGSTASIFSIRW